VKAPISGGLSNGYGPRGLRLALGARLVALRRDAAEEARHVVHERTSRAQHIFTLRSEGLGFFRIARELERENRRTRGACFKRSGRRIGHARFLAATLAHAAASPPLKSG
jgi:hypothetical protein